MNAVSGEFGHLKRKQYTGRIDGKEKTIGVSDHNKPIDSATLLTILIINNRIDLVGARGPCHSLPARLDLLYLLMENLSQVLAAVLHQIFGVGNYTDTGDVIFERDIPEPAVASHWSTQYQSCPTIEIGFTVRPFEVRIEDSFFELGITDAPTKFV